MGTLTVVSVFTRVVASFMTIAPRLSQIMEDLCQPFICNYPSGFIISSIDHPATAFSLVYSHFPSPLSPAGSILSGYTFDEVAVVHYLGRSFMAVIYDYYYCTVMAARYSVAPPQIQKLLAQGGGREARGGSCHLVILFSSIPLAVELDVPRDRNISSERGGNSVTAGVSILIQLEGRVTPDCFSEIFPPFLRLTSAAGWGFFVNEYRPARPGCLTRKMLTSVGVIRRSCRDCVQN